jgi:putative ABC transport system permease protein
MTFRDTFGLALRNLNQAKLRTALTTLGVSIGIASLAGMMSLGVGLEEQLTGRFTQSGLFDAITVTRQAPRFAGRGARGRGFGPRLNGPARGRGAAPDEPRPPLDDAAIAALAALPAVREVYPNIRVPVGVTLDQADDFAMASGTPASARNEGAFQSMTAGTFFPDGAADACMLTLDFLKGLTDKAPADVVGRTITLSYATSPVDLPGMVASGAGMVAPDVPQSTLLCRISGIVEREPGTLAGAGLSGVMVPLETAKTIDAAISEARRGGAPDGTPANTRTYSSLTVRVSGAEHTQDVEDKIKNLHFTAFSIADALQGAKRAFLILDIVLALIGSIALAVSSLGIVNTMVMSILERTREIGIMKAIGGGDGDIRRIFLVEASTIGLLGGAAGIALGWAVGRIINFGANIYIRSQGGAPGNLFSLPLWLIGGAIAFSWVVSLIAGSYPARRAARLDPIQALRHD